MNARRENLIRCAPSTRRSARLVDAIALPPRASLVDVGAPNEPGDQWSRDAVPMRSGAALRRSRARIDAATTLRIAARVASGRCALVVAQRVPAPADVARLDIYEGAATLVALGGVADYRDMLALPLMRRRKRRADAQPLDAEVAAAEPVAADDQSSDDDFEAYNDGGGGAHASDDDGAANNRLLNA